MQIFFTNKQRMNIASRKKLDPILDNYFRNNPKISRTGLMHQIASRAKVHYSTVYRWFEKIEAGEDLKPSCLRQIANVLGVDWTEIA